ncbi:MAG TPA: hypothetical protein VGI20_15610 [Rhizomicrobium sp.]
MPGLMRIGLTAAIFAAGAVTAASAASTQSFILKGYSFGPMPGVNTAEIEAKLPRKAGARITGADVAAEEAIVERELKARHVQGRLFASTAVKRDRMWIIFDLVQEPVRILVSQSFVGASHVSPEILARATGLRPGTTLSVGKLNAARRSILAAYGKALHGKPINLKLRMQTRHSVKPGTVPETWLTWTIVEPKSSR